MSKIPFLIVSCALLLGSACGDDTTDATGGGDAAPIEVEAADFSFDPTTIEATSGQELEVTLVNTGEVEHSFTIEGVVDVEAEGGEEASGTFTAPDENVEFFCKFHPDQMRGTLDVGAEPAGGGGGGDMGRDDDLDY